MSYIAHLYQTKLKLLKEYKNEMIKVNKIVHKDFNNITERELLEEYDGSDEMDVLENHISFLEDKIYNLKYGNCNE